MTLEDLVADRELCQAWKDMGGRQDTIFYYDLSLPNAPPRMLPYGVKLPHPDLVAAPTTGEVMGWYKHKTEDLYHAILYWKNGSISFPNALLKMAMEVKP